MRRAAMVGLFAAVLGAGLLSAADEKPALVVSEITLERSGGKADGPRDALTIRADGAAVYVGNKNVERIGRYEGKVPDLYFKKAFPLLQAMYAGLVKAPPSTGKPTGPVTVITLRVVANGKEQVIVDHCPGLDERLWALEMAARGVAADVVWKKAPEKVTEAGPLRLDISLDKKEYRLRGAITLTISYTNTSKEAVVLWGNGTAVGQGFAGETVEVTSGAGRTTYTFFAVDPKVEKIVIHPGKKWTRVIKELAAELSGSGVAIDGKVPDGTEALPDPFGRLDDYTIRVWFQSEVKAQPKPAFNGKVQSNAVKFRVGLR